ncbi:MAG: glycosyltransferase family 4 protein [Deltaproteobacteria bacterium]|nr:glycosyltransferase family 4 protein [Deltaproteobacteria bacterium]
MSLPVVVDGIIYQLQPLGGISRLFSEILPRIREIDPDIRIVLFTDTDAKLPTKELQGITPLIIPKVERYLRPARLWVPLISRIRESARTLWLGMGRGHIWHSTYYTMPKHWKGKQVVTVVDMIHERFSNLFSTPEDVVFRKVKRRCVESADAIICISETTRRDLETFYGICGDYVHVIPLGCSEVFTTPSRCSKPEKSTECQPFLLYVGDRNHYKNFTGLVGTYAKWHLKKDVPLVVVGRRWTLSEKQLLANLKIDNLITLVTDLDDEGLNRLYHRASALVYPSLYEGFGIPLLEAMKCGCPIIASHIPSSLEIAGECPVYFEPHEESSLLAALDLLMSEGRNSARTAVGIERVKRYSWDNTARGTLCLYHKLKDAMNRR